MSQTVLANLTVKQKVCANTEQPEVMKRLHSGDTGFLACVVCGGRQFHPEIVYVSDIGPNIRTDLPDLPVRRSRPDG
jgi:peptide methionine sulfoxide reductase MsrB